MNTLKIRRIDREFVISPGKVYSVNIEHRGMFLRFMDAVVGGDKDYFSYSEDGVLVDFEKKSVCITDCFTMDPNGRKILNSLYKRIDATVTDDSDKELINGINGQILGLLDKISLDMGMRMRFEDELDLTKILGLYKFEFDCDDVSLTGRLVSYLKANMEIMDLRYALCINVLPLISEDDFDLFQKELEALGLALINVNFVNRHSNKNIETVIIDEDLCEI